MWSSIPGLGDDSSLPEPKLKLEALLALCHLLPVCPPEHSLRARPQCRAYVLEVGFYTTRKPTEHEVHLMLSWFSRCIKTNFQQNDESWYYL